MLKLRVADVAALLALKPKEMRKRISRREKEREREGIAKDGTHRTTHTHALIFFWFSSMCLLR